MCPWTGVSRPVICGKAIQMTTASQDRCADVLVIGGGAAGMMCAIQAGRRGRSVIVLEKAKLPGRKIRISGGGRCNFTNLNAQPEHYVSENPRFCISALSRYTPEDFVAWVDSAGIAHHEKTKGQLFCDGSAQQIVDLLTDACEAAGVRLICKVDVERARANEAGFEVEANGVLWQAESLVVACGGPSIPKMGASRLGYGIANHFGLAIIEPRAALVPLTFSGDLLRTMSDLSGVSLRCTVRCNKQSFTDHILYTHRGLSGPAILQISTFWCTGSSVSINLLPELDVVNELSDYRHREPKRRVDKLLSQWLPSRLAQVISSELGLSKPVAELSTKKLKDLGTRIHDWRVQPSGTEGMRTAEVTLGGVDTRVLSPKTFEVRSVPNLYFIGEVLDVTGQLGGYNFQWAWASGHACGEVV